MFCIKELMVYIDTLYTFGTIRAVWSYSSSGNGSIQGEKRNLNPKSDRLAGASEDKNYPSIKRTYGWLKAIPRSLITLWKKTRTKAEGRVRKVCA